MPVNLKVIENPSEENAETAGASYWADQLIRVMKNPNDKEALDYLRKRHELDTASPRKPELALSSVGR